MTSPPYAEPMKKITTFVLMATSFVFLTGWYGRCGRTLTIEEKKARIEKHSTSMVEDLMEDLDATKTQEQQAQQIRARVVKETLPMLDQHEESKKFFHDQWKSDSPDREAIHQQVDERVDDMRKLFHLAADGIVDFHQLLTKEQRQEIEEMGH